MTALEIFISNHQNLSYLIIFVGMFIEADLFFLTAAIFADQKYLEWPVLMAVSYVGIVLGDIAFYYLGKYSENTRLGNWLNKRFRKYHQWLDQNFIPRYFKLVFFTKFLYYINRLMPFLAGWHKMEFRKFLKIHFYADLSWLIIMSSIGFGLSALVALVGTKWVLERMWLFFLVLGAVFISGNYFLKRFFSKKIERIS